ncbi:putative multi-domain containing protein [Aduncisulcus paluster]|uniref:Multi-domain containing protein n=1 Tax=Aduncisulcus paluster TaxID=2918883 RepID=A0ABQ5KNW7_9EUKA|nr:putative multi-domain containing protein [Aduncisulcus paluster]
MAPPSQQKIKLKKGKLTFELLVKPNTVRKWRQGEIGSLDNVLIIDEIFSNSSKGEKASDADITAIFGDMAKPAVIERILREGDIELTTAERRQLVDKKKAGIIAFIHGNFINPTSKLPHPQTRIEQALKQIKPLNIDPFIAPDLQVETLLPKIKKYIPLKPASQDVTITLPPTSIGKGMSIIYQHTKVLNERYDREGNCILEVTILPGAMEVLSDKLSKSCGGYYNMAFHDEMEGAVVPEGEKESGKKGKKGKKAKKAKKGK